MLKGIESFIDHIKSVETHGVCYWKKAITRNSTLETFVIYIFLITSIMPFGINWRLLTLAVSV